MPINFDSNQIRNKGDIMNATKTNFINEYKGNLVRLYAWATDEVKLAHFMESVELTIRHRGNSFNRSGVAYEATLKALGLPKSTTLKALHNLPE